MKGRGAVKGNQRARLKGPWDGELQVQFWFCVVRRWFLPSPDLSVPIYVMKTWVRLSFPIWGSVILKRMALLLLALGSRRAGSRLQG